jgi:hypothetical protein
MSKFVQHASYYIDDKDLSDLFKAQHVAPRFLLKFARRRGLFFSEKSEKDNLIRALCMAPISWDDVNVIAESINTDERDNKQMTTQISGGIDFDGIQPALERVKSWLEADRNVPTLTKTSENTYKLEVRFVELQPQRTRPLQRVEKQVTVELERVGGRLDIRYSEHDHAKEIVRKLVDEIPTKEEKEKSERRVSLWSIRDPLARIRFFTELINGVEGFILSGVTDLHLDRRFPVEEDDDIDNDDDVASTRTKEEQLVGLVKHAVLTGDSLLNSEFYLDLRNSGYYIGNIVWTASETGGDQRQVEFYAGFKDAILATDFVFDIRRIAKRDKDGNYGKAERHQPVDRPRLLKLLESAAYESLERLEKSLMQSAGKRR